MVTNFYGPSMPFFDLDGNPLPRQEGRRLLKNDLLQLLFTSPGERVKRPGFGTPLKLTPMEQMTPVMLDVLRGDIISAINTNDPRYAVQYLQMDPDFDNHTINIKLSVTIVDDPMNDLVIDTTISL